MLKKLLKAKVGLPVLSGGKKFYPLKILFVTIDYYENQRHAEGWAEAYNKGAE